MNRRESPGTLAAAAACGAPYAAKLAEPLAVTGRLLYRRGNYNDSFEQPILDALMAVKGAERNPGLA